MNLERSLIPGLYNEVVVSDSYRVLDWVKYQIDWSKTTVFDIGANIGVFTRHVQKQLPDTRIISVEPHADNFKLLGELTPNKQNVTLVNAAIASGKVWRSKSAVTGAHESYHCVGLGYSEGSFEDERNAELVEVPTVLLPELIERYVPSGFKYVIKLDCEGGENAVFSDPKSVNTLCDAEIIVAELHYHAATKDQLQEVRQVTDGALEELGDTHLCELVSPMFYAEKKQYSLRK